MESDLAKWIEEDAKEFLKKIGIRKGYAVLDFGCGRGHYTIPVSKLVGNIGIVYALDKNKSALNKLEGIIAKEDIKNVELVDDIKNSFLGNQSVDVVLCYDVLHYMKSSDRKFIYKDIWRVLREKALFSVYPKHCRGNLPSGELADVSIGAVTEEIESVGFVLTQRFQSKLLHDSSFEEGFILNFRKGG